MLIEILCLYIIDINNVWIISYYAKNDGYLFLVYGNYVEEEYPEIVDTNLYSDELNGEIIRGEYEETQTILTDNCSQYGITATCFDAHENLLWVGNQLVCYLIMQYYYFFFLWIPRYKVYNLFF